MLVDEFLSMYDVSETVSTVVVADAAIAWQALMEVDLLEVGRRRPLVAALGAIRGLPDLVTRVLHGKAPLPVPNRLRLRDLTALPQDQGGWTLLAERDREEIALGIVGKFWRPVITYGEVPAGSFDAFNEPGYAKTICSFSVRGLGERRTLLSGVTRTATTDEHARRWFRRYCAWGVGSIGYVMVNGLLDLTRDMAEDRQRRAPWDEEALCR